MQIYRPYRDHAETAKYLDNSRLNKQVVEAYQIAKSILIKVGLMDGKPGWWQHPITQNIWNNGKPCLFDLCQYMVHLDHEWRCVRKKNRSDAFLEKIGHVSFLVAENSVAFSYDEMRPCFVGNGLLLFDSDDVFEHYRNYLAEKWRADKRPPKWT